MRSLLNLLSCKEVRFLFITQRMGTRCLLCICSACRSGFNIWTPETAGVQNRSSQQIRKCNAVWEFFLQNCSLFLGGVGWGETPIKLFCSWGNVRGEKRWCFLLFLFSYSFKQHNELMPPGFWFLIWDCIVCISIQTVFYPVLTVHGSSCIAIMCIILAANVCLHYWV